MVLITSYIRQVLIGGDNPIDEEISHLIIRISQQLPEDVIGMLTDKRRRFLGLVGYL